MTHSDFWSKIKYIITSRRFYEYTFISVILSTFMLWLFKIFYEGNLSEQFNIFFRGCSDFLADILNVVGYSSQRDVYNNTMYTGLAEKAYPPLTYVFAYFLSRLVDMGQYYKLNYFLWMYQEPRFLIIYLILAIITMIMVYELICTCKTGCHSLKIVTAVTCLLSAPMLYSLERANTIIITMFCTMFFSFFYDSQKCLLRQLAYLSFAVIKTDTCRFRHLPSAQTPVERRCLCNHLQSDPLSDPICFFRRGTFQSAENDGKYAVEFGSIYKQ